MKLGILTLGAATITLAGCSVSVSTTAESTTPSSIAEVTTTEVTPTTAETTTTTTTTIAASTSAAPTTVATPQTDGPACLQLQSQSAWTQMGAVRDGNAPSLEECPAAVSAADRAATVFDASEEMIRTINEDGTSFLVGMKACDDNENAYEFVNAFDAPVIFWGVFSVGDKDDNKTKALQMFVSEVVPPGETYVASASRKGLDDARCFVDAFAILAPVGDLAQDAGIVVPAPTGPQTSDDIVEWLPALLANQEVAGDSLDPRVASVYDIHNPSIVTRAPEEGFDTRSPVQVCGTFDVTEGRDDTGQLVLATRIADHGAGPGIEVGLYRRGSDKVWRLAEFPIFLQLPAADNLCDSAPSL